MWIVIHLGGVMKKLAMLLFGVSAALLSGCASIISEPTQNVTITSDPAEAEVTITNKAGVVIHKGVTPQVIELKKSRGYFKGETYKLLVSKKGYVPQETTIDSYPNGWYIGGNLIFGGLIGWIVVDPLTGSMFTLTPDEVNAKLAKHNQK